MNIRFTKRTIDRLHRELNTAQGLNNFGESGGRPCIHAFIFDFPITLFSKIMDVVSQFCNSNRNTFRLGRFG